MYSSRPSYSSPPPELSNNPFIDHSSNALARFPDISGSDDLSSGSSNQYTSWLNRPQTSAVNTNQSGYFPQGATSPTGYGGGYQAQPQATGWGQQGGSGFAQPQQQQPYGQMMSPPLAQPQMSSGQFQPSSSFGQQLVGHVNGAYGGGAPQQQQQQPQYSGYPTSPQYGQGYQQGYPSQQQQQPQQQQYMAEFDPYSQNQGGTPGAGAGGQYPGQPQQRQHPREFVQSHKSELEVWDSYTWKQAQNTFDNLKAAWEVRKTELEARLRAMGGAGLFGGGAMYGGPAQQYAQLENMAKEAGLHVDTVAASSFQMQEVFAGYRQSGDIASKRRVREAINAALSSLPDWPQPLY
ncbi:hypothetical protein TRAPUB_12000 [Trametes pubescens]|uniref:Uncharacterized protein n=1 Tax=Trametes pubescens TaxID=154538 RepID=A0A1M2VV52_TRAPU|nr:hypothetical protein TRAPUB_12000 [Trametes pubescens]